MNCLENVKTFRSKGKVLFCWWSSPPSTSGHSIKITFLSSSVHISRSLPLTRNFINNVFIFQAPPPTCSHAAAKYPQKIIAMRRYWIIIIAIPFNSFQLWSYNSIFGIRAKWVTTTSWNCFFLLFFWLIPRNVEQYHASHIHDFNILIPFMLIIDIIVV